MGTICRGCLCALSVDRLHSLPDHAVAFDNNSALFLGDHWARCHETNNMGQTHCNYTCSDSLHLCLRRADSLSSSILNTYDWLHSNRNLVHLLNYIATCLSELVRWSVRRSSFQQRDIVNQSPSLGILRWFHTLPQLFRASILNCARYKNELSIDCGSPSHGRIQLLHSYDVLLGCPS